MNRHDRRAAGKQRPSRGLELNAPPADAARSPVQAPETGSPITISSSDLPQGVILDSSIFPGHEAPTQTPHKAGLLTRALAHVLLSRWVLKRVQHPDVEQLLTSFAREAGRLDIADELTRRRSTRNLGLS
jgi:hypothetical protein